jgi:hypothetical protein
MYCNATNQKIIRAPAACRRHLVFVRAGGSSPWPFRTGWRGAERNFDIAASYFSPPDEDSALFRNADFILAGGLSKFHAGQKFLQNTPWLAHYQSVLFVDDDILFGFRVDDFLAFCEDQKFAVAQPALTSDSYYTFEITRHHPGMVYRTTTFVETMCPLFAAAHLRRVIHTFDRCISSYGLDIFWSVAVPDGETAAIIDCFQMRHTRPITNGGAFYKYLESIGVDRWAELRDMLVSLGLTHYPIVPKHCHFKPDAIAIPRVTGVNAA